jgi:hypothetical protein
MYKAICRIVCFLYFILNEILLNFATIEMFILMVENFLKVIFFSTKLLFEE